jgi:tetratricopeptide (TPR) repeat protein
MRRFENMRTSDDWTREFDEYSTFGVRCGTAEVVHRERERERARALVQRTDSVGVRADATWGNTALDEYVFAEENPFRSHAQPFERGVELLKRGQTSDAVLAFEAAVQRRPEHADAWRLLGQAHAQNDKDDRAITALRRATSASHSLWISIIAFLLRPIGVPTRRSVQS